MTPAAIEASEPTEKFSACVAAYKASVAELWQTEERMREALAAMRAQGAPRERLIAAASVLLELQEVLRGSAPLPEASEAPPAALSDRAA